MLIVGTGGLTLDVIASMEEDMNGWATSVTLFDNVNPHTEKFLNYYPVLQTDEDLLNYLKNQENKDFIVCIGNPLLRFRLSEKVKALGGKFSNYLSEKTCAISPFTKIEQGIIIQQGCIISRNVIIEEGVFLNASVVLGHDVILNQFVSIGPGAKILGKVEIGEFSYIGCNAIILPGVKIGKKVRIGVGKVIDYDVPDNSKIT